jgi:tetratricopeptide (TPR) repeat protein
MKKTLLFALAAFLTTAIYCQSTSLEQAVREGLTKIDSAKTVDNLRDAVNHFQRISMAAPDRWEVLYHYAFAQITLSFRESDAATRDKILDQAEVNINKALELNGDKSELHTLLGLLYQARIRVDASRGMEYSQKAAEMFGRAMSENPQNPRAQFLMGQNIYYTPEGFGGGCANAMPNLTAAQELFAKEDRSSALMPHWGSKTNNQLIESCNHQK